MKNKILEGLQEYFKNTPREQVEKDWAKYDYLNSVGPTLKEFQDIQSNSKDIEPEIYNLVNENFWGLT